MSKTTIALAKAIACAEEAARALLVAERAHADPLDIAALRSASKSAEAQVTLAEAAMAEAIIGGGR